MIIRSQSLVLPVLPRDVGERTESQHHDRHADGCSDGAERHKLEGASARTSELSATHQEQNTSPLFESKPLEMTKAGIDWERIALKSNTARLLFFRCSYKVSSFSLAHKHAGRLSLNTPFCTLRQDKAPG